MNFVTAVLLLIAGALAGAFVTTFYTYWQLSTGRRTVKGFYLVRNKPESKDRYE